MSIELRFEEMPDHVIAWFTGTGRPAEAEPQFEAVAERCQRARARRLLIDFTGMKGDLSIADRYFLGEKAKIFALARVKVAAVGTLEQVDPGRFGELVARNRGADLCVFTDLRLAREWLLA